MFSKTDVNEMLLKFKIKTKNIICNAEVVKFIDCTQCF